MANSFHAPQEFDVKRNVFTHHQASNVPFSSFSSFHMIPFSKCVDQEFCLQCLLFFQNLPAQNVLGSDLN